MDGGRTSKDELGAASCVAGKHGGCQRGQRAASRPASRCDGAVTWPASRSRPMSRCDGATTKAANERSRAEEFRPRVEEHTDDDVVTSRSDTPAAGVRFVGDVGH